ncbi:hypothetical protein D9M72_486610 [compost metagenome]
MAGQECQELTGVALIGLDGVVGEAPLPHEPIEPTLAFGKEFRMADDEELVHCRFPSWSIGDNALTHLMFLLMRPWNLSFFDHIELRWSAGKNRIGLWRDGIR